MRVLIQRAKDAQCTVGAKLISAIDYGYMLLVGFTAGDNIDSVKKMVKKIVNLRIFEDDRGKMNLNIKQIQGKIMAIPQFTLYASCKEGNRPSFTGALKYDAAAKLYQEFLELLQAEIVTVPGAFGENMAISFTNLGPCTIALEI